MRVVNPVCKPFEFCMFMRKENIESVLLPTFVDVLYLSPEVRGVKPASIRNWTQADPLELYHINQYKQRGAQELDVR